MPRAEDMAAWVPKDGDNIDIIAVGMQVSNEHNENTIESNLS